MGVNLQRQGHKTKTNLRERLSTTLRCGILSNAESYPNGTLISHIPKPAPRPRSLHVRHPARNPIIPCINQQRDPNVGDLGYERVLLLVRSMSLNLREDESIPVVQNSFGQASDWTLRVA